jgi:hypothetical protein
MNGRYRTDCYNCKREKVAWTPSTVVAAEKKEKVA